MQGFLFFIMPYSLDERYNSGYTPDTRPSASIQARTGFLHQTDEYKTAAVIAQRAGDITTRN